MSLLIAGTVAFDKIETPFGKTGRIIGGAATYTALAASYFTSDTRIVSAVGDDFPEEYTELLNKRGVDTLGLVVKEGEKSFFWSARYKENMNQRETLVTELNVIENFNPVIPEAYKNSGLIMLGNLLPDIQISVIEQLNSKPRLIVLDTMNYWIEKHNPMLIKAISMTDVLTINDEEARQLTGEYYITKAAKKILGMGPSHLIVKKGEHGALLVSDGKMFFAPALPLNSVLDPTGAGDSFAGGMLGYLSNSGEVDFENMKRAVIAGSVMASFCVEKFGTDNLLNLTKTEIKERIDQFANLVEFDRHNII